MILHALHLLFEGLEAGIRVGFEIDGQFDASPLAGLVTRIERDGQRVTIYGKGDHLLGDLVRALERQGCRFRNLRSEQPRLEDVFLSLTARQIRN